MPQPFTVVTLADEDGDEFPIRLPGVYRGNQAADYDAALQIAAELTKAGEIRPRGDLTLHDIEWVGA